MDAAKIMDKKCLGEASRTCKRTRMSLCLGYAQIPQKRGIKKSKRESKTGLAVIPAGLTLLAQPLDISIDKPFNERLRQQWNIWNIVGENTFTKEENL